MSLDVNKIITESINEAAGFNDIYKQAIDDMASGKAAEIVYDKIHPEKPDMTLEMAKRLGRTVQKLKQTEEELRREKELGVGEHLARAGKKALAAAKKEAGEHFTLKPEEMDLPKTGALAAAVAAGLGALALRKKLKNMK